MAESTLPVGITCGTCARSLTQGQGRTSAGQLLGRDLFWGEQIHSNITPVLRNFLAYLLSIPEGFENHQIKLEYLAIWKIEMRSIYLETPSNSADVTQLLNSKDGSLQAGGNSVRQLSPPELVGD